MSKRVVVMVLCLVFIFALVATSCTKKADEAETSSAPEKTAETQQETKEEVSNFNETGFPVVNEKVTFTLVARQNLVSGPYSEVTMVKRQEELTNIHIEWEEVPGDNFQERKNIILASSDLPDGFFGDGITDIDILTYGPQGIFVPLEDYIDKYGVEMKKAMDKDPNIISVLTSPDGHIYSLPTIEQQQYLNAGAHFFINKTWLDQVGIDKVPETTDEYADALRAFKAAGDLNGNGKDDELYLSFLYDNSIDGINAMFGAWGIPDNAENHISLDENGQAVCVAALDSYKEGLKYFNMLYSEGLIDPESFTQDYSQYVAKGKVDDLVYGSFMRWADFHVVDWEKARNDYTYMLPLKGPEGEQNWLFNDAWYIRNRMEITSACDMPEALYRWADPMFEEIASVEWIYGAMDEAIGMQDDGTIGWLPAPEGMDQQEWRAKSTPMFGPAIASVEVCAKLDRSAEEGVIRRRDRTEAYLPYLYMNYYPKSVWFTEEQSEQISILSTDIVSYIEKASADFIIQGGVDEGWDAYLQQLEKMGLAEMIEIYQQAYDIYASAQ